MQRRSLLLARQGLRSIGSSSRNIASRTLVPTATPCPSGPSARIRPIHSSSARSSGLQNIFDIDAPNDPLARPRLAVQKLTDEGFHLTDGLIVPGGVVFLDNRAFLWDVDPPGVDPATGRGKWDGWSKERFKIFETVVPRPEILLLGTGLTVIPPPAFIRDYISGLGIQLDIMDSRNACSTFNLLSEEGRTVGAALMPLKNINPRTGYAR